jgi:hypothetical protein
MVAYGKVAEELAKAKPSNHLKFTGFIDRKGARNPQIELHVTGCESVTELEIPAPV